MIKITITFVVLKIQEMKITEIIRSKGIKVTPQRLAVYRALSELCHASVEEIVMKVAVNNPTITTATVYNVLDCFAENDIITRLNTPKGKMYYDIATHTHHHLIDNDGTIIDYENNELSELIDAYIKEHPLLNFNIERVNIQLIGTKN